MNKQIDQYKEDYKLLKLFIKSPKLTVEFLNEIKNKKLSEEEEREFMKKTYTSLINGSRRRTAGVVFNNLNLSTE